MKSHGFFRDFLTGFFLALALVALYHGYRYFVTPEGRSPAAIDKDKIFDLSYLDDSALKSASVSQLLKNATVVKNERSLGVSLGHFVSKTPSGERQFLCDIYDHIELSFEADGMASNGERPKLVVQAPCVPGENLNAIKQIEVPYLDIKQMPTSDGEFSFGGYHDYLFKVSSVGGQWPDQWTLTEVKLTNKIDPALQIQIDRRQVYNTLSKPVVLNWGK